MRKKFLFVNDFELILLIRIYIILIKRHKTVINHSEALYIIINPDYKPLKQLILIFHGSSRSLSKVII
jgi:hypothetical protein